MQAVERVLTILTTLARSPRGLTLAELADRTSIPTASAYRLLTVLVDQHYATRSPTNRRYFIGASAHALARATVPSTSPLATAHHAMEEAAAMCDETVFLSEYTSGKVICIAMVESSQPLRLHVRIGQQLPLHAAAASRVLLAWMDKDVVRELLEETRLPVYTEGTPTTSLEVVRRLRQIRELGYDTCESELDEDVWAVSAPIASAAGPIVASVTIATPQSRAAIQESRDRLLSIVQSTAAAMSSDLGGRPPACVSEVRDA